MNVRLLCQTSTVLGGRSLLISLPLPTFTERLHLRVFAARQPSLFRSDALNVLKRKSDKRDDILPSCKHASPSCRNSSHSILCSPLSSPRHQHLDCCGKDRQHSGIEPEQPVLNILLSLGIFSICARRKCSPSYQSSGSSSSS